MRRIPRSIHHLVVWQCLPGHGRLAIPVLYLFDPEAPEAPPQRAEHLRAYLAENVGRSETWMLRVVRTAGALYDYVAQRREHFMRLAKDDPGEARQEILREFTLHSLRGTVDLDGPDSGDPTRLWWLPSSTVETRLRLHSLAKTGEWLENKGKGGALVDALASARAPRNMPEILGYVHDLSVKRKVSLLSYLDAAAQPSLNSWPGLLGRDASRGAGNPVRFPAAHVAGMVGGGFAPVSGDGGQDFADEDAAAKIVAALMFFGGVRSCEPLHLWVNDIQHADGQPTVFLYHPWNGVARDGDGAITRASVLKANFGMLPRNAVKHCRTYAGWKGIKGDKQGALLHWLPIPHVPEFVKILLDEYRFVIRPRIMAVRREKRLPDHPFLLVGSGRGFGDAHGEVGEPYTRAAFRAAWGRALGRLRRETGDPYLELRKSLGTTPHGARHFYANYIKSLGVDGAYIQEVLHHLSPLSHLVYTQPTVNEINERLNNPGAAAPVDPSAANATSEGLKQFMDQVRRRHR